MEMIVRNVNEAFAEIFWKMRTSHLPALQPTRNGPAYVVDSPVTTVYTYPQERVLFHQGRDANPIFHLMESIWMLAGRNDVAFLNDFNSTIHQFSDDGVYFNAAYGHRWRRYFGFDQLLAIVNILASDPGSRQAVLQMWCPSDLTKKTKDKACNMSAVFEVRDEAVNMTVFNRSNDIWWGAYGANAVHFSVLQEFIASSLGRRVGVYRQVSNNLHLYRDLYPAEQYMASPPNDREYDEYVRGTVETLPIMTTPDAELFLCECEKFCDNPYQTSYPYVNTFFREVAIPMANISRVRRAKLSAGYEYVDQIVAEDWKLACKQWVDRREARKA